MRRTKAMVRKEYWDREAQRINRDEAKYKKLAEQLESEYEGTAFVEFDFHSEGIGLKLWGIADIADARRILKLYEELMPLHLDRK